LAISVPLGGGIVFGIFRELIARWRPEREIDPIEANALHGGRMSLLGSIIVAAQTVWSSGVGASVGLDAGYTQLASGIASRLGMVFRLRRADLRILVGCGAAGGIAGAFGAPLAVSALLGYLVAHALAPAGIGVVAPELMIVATYDLVIAAAIGLLCAMAGILMMRGVALCEALFVRLNLRLALRTTIGGLLVGLLAIVAPQVMSSGHGALYFPEFFTFRCGPWRCSSCSRSRHRSSRSAPASAAGCSFPRYRSGRSAAMCWR
jgi:CIC family chloride channel protein